MQTPNAKPKRERILKIRLSDAEHERLTALANGRPLAEWLRDVGLSGSGIVQRKRPPVPVPTIDPELLRQIVSIGNNLNQIARRLNSDEWGVIDRVRILTALSAISRDLATLKSEAKNESS